MKYMLVGVFRRLVERHGEHVGQEGVPGQAGGSGPGFTHVPGSVGGEDSDPVQGGGKAGTTTGRQQVGGAKYAAAFAEAMADNPRAGYVTERSAEELDSLVALYLSEDSKAGLAILDHGDGRIEATGGFNRGGKKGIVLEMLKESVVNDGVNYVEAFAPLHQYYAMAGFEVETESEWDPQFRPDNWSDDLGTPSYYTMKLRENNG